ncbi:uncharacterized protein EDB91DRAFT_1247064 [Suillus paluster]|uniref:uncharacterized protein n=1 Tax=Suillus paluster TaxID=48578 RepID=UPI001B86878A|nr:uncharacterized protein EDB91DRAFT_1247064 [Suillus paluster]KAG1743566.1 hypothetical protein EDB91DRAFT_1247064 [Suillus paluster]
MAGCLTFLFPQTMRTAMQCWLSKPGVQEAQNAKARARAALNRARRKKKKLTEDQTAPIASSIDDCEDLSHNVSWDANDDSVLTMDDDLPCPYDSQTLDSTKRIFQRWRKEWLVSEDTWGEAYEEALAHAHMEGTHETDIFLDQCATHALEGRTILEAIWGIVHTSCPYCRECLNEHVIYRIRAPPIPPVNIPIPDPTPCFPIRFIPPSPTMHKVHLSRISPATSTQLHSAFPTLPLCPPTPYPFHPTLSGVLLPRPIGPPDPIPTPSAFPTHSVPLVLSHPTISPSDCLTGPLLD